MVTGKRLSRPPYRINIFRTQSSEVFEAFSSVSLTSKARKREMFVNKPKSFFHPPPRNDWVRGTTARMLTSSRVLGNRGTDGGSGSSPLDVSHWPAQSRERLGGCSRGPRSASPLLPVPFKELHPRLASSFSQTKQRRQAGWARTGEARAELWPRPHALRGRHGHHSNSGLDPQPQR